MDLVHRFQWISPLLLSPHDPDTIYTAAECVFRSTDQGNSWTQISGDLTRNDKSKQVASGVKKLFTYALGPKGQAVVQKLFYARLSPPIDAAATAKLKTLTCNGKSLS